VEDSTAIMQAEQRMIRHTVATVVYRGSKTLRDAPKAFETFRIRPNARAPVEILAHLGDLFDWALSIAKGEESWHDSRPLAWEQEIDRFYSSVKAFDEYLAQHVSLACSPDKLFQGPIADALTHVGQLAMLRRLCGVPIRGENYFKADIAVGQVGPVQPTPVREFD